MVLIYVYFSESSEDESTELPRKGLHFAFTLDGTGNVMIAQFNHKNNTDTKSMFICFQLMRQYWFVSIFQRAVQTKAQNFQGSDYVPNLWWMEQVLLWVPIVTKRRVQAHSQYLFGFSEWDSYFWFVSVFREQCRWKPRASKEAICPRWKR
jgi:hypothetical protein